MTERSAYPDDALSGPSSRPRRVRPRVALEPLCGAPGACPLPTAREIADAPSLAVLDALWWRWCLSGRDLPDDVREAIRDGRARMPVGGLPS